MQIVNQTIPRALRKLGYQPEQVEAIVAYIAEHGHVIDAPGLQPEHYEVFDTAMGARSLKPMGHVRMMAACPAVPVRRDLQDGQPARDGHGRGDRGRLPAVLEARPQGHRDLPRQLQGRPAAVRRQVRLRQEGPGRCRHPGRRRRARGRREGRLRPDPQAAPEVPRLAHHLLHGRRRRGLHDLGRPRRRRARRGLPQARQAGLDPGRRDGRLLDRGLHRPAVRRPARDLRLEVHQPLASSPPASPTTPTSGWRSRSWTTSSAGSPWTTSTSRPARASASTPPTSASATSRPVPTSPSRSSALRSRGRRRPVRCLQSTTAELDPPRSSTPRSWRPRTPTARNQREVPAEPTKQAHTSAELLEQITGTAVDSPLCMTCGTKMRPAGSCYVCEGCGSTSGCS